MAVRARPSQLPAYERGRRYALAADLGIYRALLVLVSGIQMAGPKLTPATFGDALHRTRFPNPATPPLRSGWAGFPNGSHGMVNDAVAAWWSEAAVSHLPDEGTGAWCYAEGGARYKIDGWTKGPDQLFGTQCDTKPVGV